MADKTFASLFSSNVDAYSVEKLILLKRTVIIDPLAKGNHDGNVRVYSGSLTSGQCL